MIVFMQKKIIKEDFLNFLNNLKQGQINLPDVNSGNDTHLLSYKIFLSSAHKTTSSIDGVDDATIKYNEQTCNFKEAYLGDKSKLTDQKN